jgi:hypothetical protein
MNLFRILWFAVIAAMVLTLTGIYFPLTFAAGWWVGKHWRRALTTPDLVTQSSAVWRQNEQGEWSPPSDADRLPKWVRERELARQQGAGTGTFNGVEYPITLTHEPKP